jgi:DNA-binding NtrC family response regulator
MLGLTFLDLYTHYNRQEQEKLILVVEDDVFLKPVFRRIIRSIDPKMKMHWATTVEAACQKLSEESYSMVIADCLLANSGSGLALWEVCKRNQPDLPFLMVSGLSEKTIQSILGKEKSAPRCLRKPFLWRDCRTLIRDSLSASP